MKLFPKDATTTGEKVVYAVGFGIPVALYLFLLLSAMGIFKNFYSEACQLAPGWCTFLGIAFSAGLVYGIYLHVKDSEKAPSHLVLFGLAAMSLLSFCAFTYPFWSK